MTYHARHPSDYDETCPTCAGYDPDPVPEDHWTRSSTLALVLLTIAAAALLYWMRNPR